MIKSKGISTQTLRRLPLYLSYLKNTEGKEFENVSAVKIAKHLHLNEVQVRKDLASVSSGGRPKTGYIKASLIADIEQFLGYNTVTSAVLVGVGNLGRALLSYGGFILLGLDIVKGFDIDEAIVNTKVGDKEILHINEMQSFCKSNKIKIGIITVPQQYAQKVCDELIESGVGAIWNFTSIYLEVPRNIVVHNENMACSLAILSNHLKEKTEM